jgi:hypothetical protein
MRKSIITPLLAFALCAAVSCSTGSLTSKDRFDAENEAFLKADPKAKELFRVLLTSNRYTVSQMRNLDTIKRGDDPGGDKYFMDELKKYDKIDEAREGVVSIWLYPDSGKMMKVRPKNLTFLKEIDNMLFEDVQRWNYEFPRKREIEPNHFDIRYRIVLRKVQTDDDIMKEMREKIKEKTGAR